MENQTQEIELKTEQKIQYSAVINPYALAELIAGRKINWKKISDARKVLEEILQTPYDKLFDPKYNSPLYIGLKLNEKLQLERVIPEIKVPDQNVSLNDLEQYKDFEINKSN